MSKRPNPFLNDGGDEICGNVSMADPEQVRRVEPNLMQRAPRDALMAQEDGETSITTPRRRERQKQLQRSTSSKKQKNQTRKKPQRSTPSRKKKDETAKDSLPTPKYTIQEWHIVLADKNRRPGRTTIATELLIRIKEKYRKQYNGDNRKKWIPVAIQELYTTLGKMSWKHNQPKDIGLVIVKCTPDSIGRVATPNIFGYPDDKEALFGTGTPQALNFFFTSGDSPKLEDEIRRHMQRLESLRQSADRPPKREMDDFQKTLEFFQAKVDAKDECILAKHLLESLKPINSLKQQWKLLFGQKSQHKVGSQQFEHAHQQQEDNNHHKDDSFDRGVQGINDEISCKPSLAASPNFAPAGPCRFEETNPSIDDKNLRDTTMTFTCASPSKHMFPVDHMITLNVGCDQGEKKAGVEVPVEHSLAGSFSTDANTPIEYYQEGVAIEQQVDYRRKLNLQTVSRAEYSLTPETNLQVETELAPLAGCGGFIDAPEGLGSSDSVCDNESIAHFLQDIQFNREYDDVNSVSNEDQEEEQSSQSTPTTCADEDNIPYIGCTIDRRPYSGLSHGESDQPYDFQKDPVSDKLRSESLHLDSEPEYTHFSLDRILRDSFGSRKSSKSDKGEERRRGLPSQIMYEESELQIKLHEAVREAAPWLDNPDDASIPEAAGDKDSQVSGFPIVYADPCHDDDSFQPGSDPERTDVACPNRSQTSRSLRSTSGAESDEGKPVDMARNSEDTSPQRQQCDSEPCEEGNWMGLSEQYILDKPKDGSQHRPRFSGEEDVFDWAIEFADSVLSKTGIQITSKNESEPSKCDISSEEESDQVEEITQRQRPGNRTQNDTLEERHCDDKSLGKNGLNGAENEDRNEGRVKHGSGCAQQDNDGNNFSRCGRSPLPPTGNQNAPDLHVDLGYKHLCLTREAFNQPMVQPTDVAPSEMVDKREDLQEGDKKGEPWSAQVNRGMTQGATFEHHTVQKAKDGKRELLRGEHVNQLEEKVASAVVYERKSAPFFKRWKRGNDRSPPRRRRRFGFLRGLRRAWARVFLRQRTYSN